MNSNQNESINTVLDKVLKKSYTIMAIAGIGCLAWILLFLSYGAPWLWTFLIFFFMTSTVLSVQRLEVVTIRHLLLSLEESVLSAHGFARHLFSYVKMYRRVMSLIFLLYLTSRFAPAAINKWGESFFNSHQISTLIDISSVIEKSILALSSLWFVFLFLCAIMFLLRKVDVRPIINTILNSELNVQFHHYKGHSRINIDEILDEIVYLRKEALEQSDNPKQHFYIDLYWDIYNNYQEIENTHIVPYMKRLSPIETLLAEFTPALDAE